MLFSTSTFLFLFLPVVLILYYNPFFKNLTFRNIMLLVCSLGFYAWGEPAFVFVMILSILCNYIFGRFLGAHKNKYIFIIAILCNLSILFCFKYMSFAISIINGVLHTSIHDPSIALPIGISFFTFQGMSYIIDVYRDKVPAQKNLFYLGLYISFFPQLIAGPIVRYSDIAQEIENRHTTKEDFNNGVYRFMMGLSKKVLVSNTLGALTDIIFSLNLSYLSAATAWLGAIAYTLQIYFDFSGYSDMAIGLGSMFGFHFLENFNYPYIASSITDFWRRWHISLSTWFRDYVYIPLGGNRVSKNRWIFNLSVVWLLTGLWHGANWTFIVWGIYYLILLLLEKLTNFPKKLQSFSHIYTLFFVIIGWVLFRSDTLSDAITYLGVMFGANHILIDTRFMIFLSNYSVFLIIGLVCSLPIHSYIVKKSKDSSFINTVYELSVMVIFMITLCFMIKGTYNPFIYFNF